MSSNETRHKSLGSWTALFAAAAALFIPASVLAHPSGLPTLRGKAQYLVATSADWLFWDWHPSIVLGILAMTGLYTLTITRWRPALSGGEPLSKARVRVFYISMVLEWVLLDGPLHHLSDELLFSAHMFQHLGLQLLWAPLFLWSWHPWQLRPLVKSPLVRRIAYKVTRPVAAFLIYNLTTAIWHIPPLYNLALRAHEWHIVEHLLFMSTACIFWWPLLGCLKEVPRPAYGHQIFYVFANMMAMKVLGIAISLQDDVIYTYYLSVPRVWGMTALGDQQIGGLLMWLPGGFLLWAGLGYVFIQIARRGTPKRGTSGINGVDELLKRRKKNVAVVSFVALLAGGTAGCNKDEAPQTTASATADKAPAAQKAAEKKAASTKQRAPGAAAAVDKAQISGTSEKGKFKFELRLSPPKPKVGELFKVVTIARHATSTAPLEGASVEVDATMPDHGHGMMTDPKHKELGGGAYLSEGMKLHMHGKWVIHVKAKLGDVEDLLKAEWIQPPEAL